MFVALDDGCEGFGQTGKWFDTMAEPKNLVLALPGARYRQMMGFDCCAEYISELIRVLLEVVSGIQKFYLLASVEPGYLNRGVYAET